MPEPTDNRTLYDRGRGYAQQVERRLRSTDDPAWDEKAAVAEVAKAAGEGVKEVRTAFNFSRQVEFIDNVVPGAREAILDGGHPHLTPAVVARIAPRPAVTIRTAMARAAAGLHPFAPEPPAGLPPDKAPWHFDLLRLRDAGALLERAVAAEHPPPAEDRADLAVHTTAILAYVDALRLVLGGRRRKPSTSPGRSGAGGRSDAVGWVADARELVRDVTGDLLRAAHTRPVDPAREELAGAVRAVAASAEAVRARFPAPVEPVAAPAVAERRGGPFDTGGTYAVVLRAGEARVVRIGRLGTFWLPAGFLLYVGTAFQPGGVAGRTDRHLGGTGPRLWGLDDLRGFAVPVGLWWTHHPDEVEHTWARALAGMPAYCCPAPVAGATDCNDNSCEKDEDGPPQRCPAHLFYTPDCPSVDAFADQLGRSGSGGYTICHRAESPTSGGTIRVKRRPPGRPGSDPCSLFG